MIRWCSFCQCYMGQKPPLNDFSFNPGICESCDAKLERNEQVAIGWGVKQFYDGLSAMIFSGQQVDPDMVLGKAKILKLKNHELLIGILHPLLYKIGNYFEEGQISIVKEHLFSRAVNEILAKVKPPYVEGGVAIILLVPDDNFHHIGVSLFQHLLAEKYAIKSYIPPSAPQGVSELEALLNRYRPALVGVSVALPEHYEYVWRLSDWLKNRMDVKLVIGGPASALLKDYQKMKNCGLIVHASDPFDTIKSAETICALVKEQLKR